MIKPNEIEQKSKSLGIDTNNVQRDYVFGWLLNGIYSNSELGNKFILKGGNGVRKGYLQHTRFSKDLDFSIQSEVSPDKFLRNLVDITKYVKDRSGIEFDVSKTAIEEKLRINDNQVYVGKLYFKNFYGEQEINLKVRLDVTEFDNILLPVQNRTLIHDYSDKDTCVTSITCQKLEEILASKMNALLHRRKVTDLFDLVYSVLICNEYMVDRVEVVKTFFNQNIYGAEPNTAKNMFQQLSIEESRPFWAELVAPVGIIFPFDTMILRFPELITSLFSTFSQTLSSEGYSKLHRFSSASYYPANIRNTIMRAGQSRTLLKMLYAGHWRDVEPYSFEYRIRQKDNVGMEYFFGFDRSGGKSREVSIKRFIIDKIQDIQNTNNVFSPQWPIEL